VPLESEAPHTGGQAAGSPTHEKAITDALNAIDGVQEMSIENGAIHVTYDPLQSSLFAQPHERRSWG